MSHFVCLPDHCCTQHHTSSSQGQVLPENKQQQAPELTRLVATPWGEASGSAPRGAGSAVGALPEPRAGGVLVHGSTAGSPSCKFSSCHAHLTSLRSVPTSPQNELPLCVESACRGKEALVSVLQQILDYIETVYCYQGW